MTINKLTKAQKIKAKIDKLHEALKVVQDTECSHTNLSIISDSSTGNYDPSADCYWYDLRCPDCLKHWTVFDSDKEEYHKYAMMKHRQ